MFRLFVASLAAVISLGPTARAAAPLLDLPAARLLPLADPSGGTVSLVAPPADKLGVQPGEILLFKPEPGDEVLTLRLPVSEDGYYRIQTHLVFGPWREGRYGMYRAKADGADLEGYFHGWYGRGSSRPYSMQWKNWGAIYLRKPEVALSFHLDTKQAGDLLGIEKVRLEPVEPEKLTEAERARRVTERPKLERLPPGPICTVDAEGPLDWVTPVAQPAKAIIVDGDLSEWDFAHPLIAVNAATIQGRGYGAPPPDSDADLSLGAQIAWDEKGLYFAARVRDDELAGTKPGAPWGSFWSHDGVVLSLASLAGRAEAAASSELTVGFNYPSPGCPPRELPKGVRYAARPTQDGYELEALVPFAAVGLVPHEGERLRFMLIAVDIDPSAPPGRRFQQYLWNTRMGDAPRWGEMRLLRSEGWGANLTPELDAYGRGQALRYLGLADVFKGGLALDAIEVVEVGSGRVAQRVLVGAALAAGRRYLLRGEIPLRNIPPGRYELRATPAGHAER